MTDVSLAGLSNEEIRQLHDLMGGLMIKWRHDGLTAYGLWTMVNRAVERMDRGVIIKTKCGSSRQIIEEQEISEILLDGKVIYQSCKESANDE